MAIQGHINNVLCKYLNQWCIVYLDNIVVYSTLLKENKKHVQLVFARLQEEGVYLKLSKYKFELQCISFVSFIVAPERVETEPDKVQIIAE